MSEIIRKLSASVGPWRNFARFHGQAVVMAKTERWSKALMVSWKSLKDHCRRFLRLRRHS